MRADKMNWMQVEAQAQRDDRCVLPIGSTEQHAYLSLATDTILAERIAVEAAEPLEIPVFPALPFGLAAAYADYPGTLWLRLPTFAAVITDLLDSLYRAGFRRIVILNGHGGNAPIGTTIVEWLDQHREVKVRVHEWWRAPETAGVVKEIDPHASHASWMENFPSTRLPGVAMPDNAKPEVPRAALSLVNPGQVRTAAGDGNYDGLYQRSDAEMDRVWQIAVAETRSVIEDGW